MDAMVVGLVGPEAPTHTHSGARDGRPTISGQGETTQIGRYCIGTLLGRGGMGCVYAAHDPELDRSVAIKVLHRSLDGSDREAVRLRREAQALARLHHPNVVTVYETGVDGGRLWMAMELVEGETLGRWADRHPPGAFERGHEALALLRQAGQGLAAAHAVGLVHRDVKPANILVGADGRVRVADFGLARRWRLETSPDEASVSVSGDASKDDAVTAAGLVIGTPRYMSPEQHAGGDLDARTDQFSFCVTAWEVLYGAPPFVGTTATALHAAILAGPARPPSPGVPSWVATVLRRGLSPRATHRFASMAALLEALEGRGRRRVVAFAGLALASITIGALPVRTATVGFVPDHACADEALQAEFDAVWNPDRRARVRTKLLGSDRPYAADVVRSTEETLDAFGNAWVSVRRRTCRELPMAEPSGATMLDGRTACLREGLGVLDAWLTAVETGAIDLEHVGDPAAGMPWPESCAGAAEQPETEDARTRQFYARIAAADAVSRAGDDRRALAQLESILAEAADERYALVRADALRLVSVVAGDLGELERAAEAGEQSYWIASARGDVRRTVRAAIETSRRHSMLHASETARRWSREAEVGLARQELGRLQRAKLLLAKSEVEFEVPDLGAAESLARDALVILSEDDSPSSAMMRSAINIHLATVLGVAGRHDEELALELDLVEETERRLGAQHPYLAARLANLGATFYTTGRSEEARPVLERALAMMRRDAPSRALALTTLLLARVLIDVGEPDAAEHAVARAKSAAPPLDTGLRREVALLDVKLLRLRAMHDEALAILEALVREYDSTPTDNVLRRAQAHEELGEVAYSCGDLHRSESELRVALGIYTAARTGAREAQAEHRLGLVLLATHDSDGSLAAFRRAEALWRGIGRERLATRLLAMQALPLAAAGRVEEAEATLAAAESAGPVVELVAVDVHEGWSALHLARGDRSRARHSMREALRWLPKGGPASVRRDRLLGFADELGFTAGEIEQLRGTADAL